MTMNESQIEDGLRNIALLEPALGFDPDEVATRAAKRKKARSTALMAGVAAGVAGLVATAMLMVPNMGDATAPATQDTVTPFERNKRHFQEIASKTITDASELTVVDLKIPYYVTNPEGSLLIGAGFEDRHGHGKTFLAISDAAPPATLGYPTPEQCFPGSTATRYHQCRLVTRQDGSTVVAANSSSPISASSAVLAIHHRKDGTYVIITITTGISKPGNGEPKPLRVAEDEAIALATDPAFALR
jgi:hypothetical protein